MAGEKKLTTNIHECCEQYWTCPRGNTPQSSIYTATKTFKIRRTSHAGHCWRSRDELMCNVLRWTPSHGWAKAGRPARTYILQLCEDTGCIPEDLPETMNYRERWRERVRDIRADGMTWWWCYLILLTTLRFDSSCILINSEDKI